MSKDETDKPLRFTLERDDHGFTAGISVDGHWIVHLQHGTVRNEQYAEWLVKRLNGSLADMPERES